MRSITLIYRYACRFAIRNKAVRPWKVSVTVRCAQWAAAFSVIIIPWHVQQPLDHKLEHGSARAQFFCRVSRY